MIYLQTKKMTFDEDNKEHEIILDISDKETFGYDYCLDVEWDFNTKIRADGWYSYPLFEYKNNKIVPFDYTKYAYFENTDRRVALATKINELYAPFSELKILRKTIKKILDNLGIVDEKFEKYNKKIEELINKNPKEVK